MAEISQRSNPTRWLAVANPLAGAFAGLQTANELAAASDHYQVDVYATAEDPAQRIREIVARIAAHEPTPEKPLGILAFGGDRTVNDALIGVMTFLFPDLNDLLVADPQEVSERMRNSGISIGVVRTGGANDVGNLTGAPSANVHGILHYLSNAAPRPMNMGVIRWDGEGAVAPFVQTTSAGNMVSPVIRSLQAERGTGAMWRRIFTGIGQFLFAKPANLLWQTNGPVWRTRAVEVMAHAVPRASGLAGLARTPAEGIAVKIGSANTPWHRAILVEESLLRGLLTHLGFLSVVGPDSRFATLPDSLQIVLSPGETIELLFANGEVPMQVAGDYVADARHLEIRALPPFPNFLVMGGSVMARIHDAGAAPKGPLRGRQETGVRREANPLKGRRILIVDDQTCIINTVRPFLEMWDMEIVTTTDPEEALRLLQTEDFDLLITDLVMPRLDGVSLLNKLIEANRFIPTLVLSGSQGNRQAAVLHHELSNGTFRELGLPLLYMKKDHEGFEEGLRERLTYLAQKQRFHHERVAEETLPRLRSVIESVNTPEEAEPTATSDPDRKKRIGSLIDQLCDLRFSLLVEAEPLLDELATLGQTLTDRIDSKRLGQAKTWWHGLPLRPREEMLGLDETGWHDFKNEVQGYWRLMEGARLSLARTSTAPENLKTRVREMEAKAHQLVKLAGNTYQLFFLRRQDDVIEPFRAVTKSLSSAHFEDKVTNEISTQSPVRLRLPGNFIRDVVDQLASNAVQATTDDRPKPAVRAGIVNSTELFSSMKVAPPANDAVGPRFRPPPDEISRRSTKYLYLGVTNTGPTLGDSVREQMLQTGSFTTKPFGTGLGLEIVKERVKLVNGWMEVQSRDGLTEVAVFVPIDDRIVTDPEPTGGGSPSPGIPTSGGETPAPVTPAPSGGQGRGPISETSVQRVSPPAPQIARSGSPPQIVARGGDDGPAIVDHDGDDMRETAARGACQPVVWREDDRKVTQLALALHRRGMRRTARFVFRMTDDQLSRFARAAGHSSIRLLAKAAGAPEEFDSLARSGRGPAPVSSGTRALPLIPTAVTLPTPSVLMSLAR